MDRLLEGIKGYRTTVLEDQENFYETLKDGQQPHTLFITCCDSRISTSDLTQTKPGEMFVVRNVANIVPPYRETDEYVATTSAIEYAVTVLGVDHIIICGHSDCGGCKAGLYGTATEEDLPHTKRWLTLLEEVRDKVLEMEEEPGVQERMMEQANILAQLENIKTFPKIKKGLEEGSLTLHGWYFNVATGEVFQYDEEEGDFILINEIEESSLY